MLEIKVRKVILNITDTNNGTLTLNSVSSFSLKYIDFFICETIPWLLCYSSLDDSSGIGTSTLDSSTPGSIIIALLPVDAMY